MPIRAASVPNAVIATGAGLVSLAVYALAFLRYLPADDGKLGSDFSYFLPQLLAGQYWQQQNGLFSVPWFTPAFCGGVPYHPNLQGVYFSLPQFLTFVMSPVAAVRASFIIFAAAGYVGAHLLLRRRFAIAVWMAATGATIFLFNGFYYSHVIAGHLTFHAYMLTPFLALCILPREPGARWTALLDPAVLMGGLIVAYMIHSGMVHAFLPALASIFALALIRALMFGGGLSPYVRMAAVVILGFLLSLSKLVAALAFLGNFHRDMLPLPGFTSLMQATLVHFMSLFMEPPVGPAGEWLVNNYWYPDLPVTFGYWELDAGVTIVPLVLLAFALVVHLREPKQAVEKHEPQRWRAVYIALLALVCIAPILLNWHQPLWTAFLKSLPVIGKSSTLLRWHVVYIPLAVLLAALAIDRLAPLKSITPHIAIASIALVFVLKLSLQTDYRMLYDPAGVVEASARARSGAVPSVTAVEDTAPTNDAMYRYPGVNDRFARGATSPRCYEPMFGHSLEEYPFKDIRPGPAMSVADGAFNIKNPACMVWPGANSCSPGDHFTQAQEEQARRFLEHRSFDFAMPASQRIANALNLIALIATLAALTLMLSAKALRLGKRA